MVQIERRLLDHLGFDRCSVASLSEDEGGTDERRSCGDDATSCGIGMHESHERPRDVYDGDPDDHSTLQGISLDNTKVIEVQLTDVCQKKSY